MKTINEYASDCKHNTRVVDCGLGYIEYCILCCGCSTDVIRPLKHKHNWKLMTVCSCGEQRSMRMESNDE